VLGELICLETFYVGKLKGVGPVWQITACDAATSYEVAAILPALTHQAAAAFLRHTLLPVFAKAGWPIQRVLTDGGGEFKGTFDEVCVARGLRHTRTKPRHAWTNGFVERLQQTILPRALARGVPQGLLHRPVRASSHPPALHALLQLRAAAPRLSRPWPDASGARFRHAGGRSLNS
jgi:transposase InsO family protein